MELLESHVIKRVMALYLVARPYRTVTDLPPPLVLVRAIAALLLLDALQACTTGAPGSI